MGCPAQYRQRTTSSLSRNKRYNDFISVALSSED